MCPGLCVRGTLPVGSERSPGCPFEMGSQADRFRHYCSGAVVGVDDDTTVLAAQLAQALGLPHNRVEAVKAARYKDVMRLALGEAEGVLSPLFWVFGITDRRATDHAGAVRQARPTGWPVLRGVNLCHAVAAACHHPGRHRRRGPARSQSIRPARWAGPCRAQTERARRVDRRSRRAVDRRAVLEHAPVWRRYVARRDHPAPGGRLGPHVGRA